MPEQPVSDAMGIRPHGHVIQRRFQPRETYRADGGSLVLDKSNLIVDSGFELMLRALMGNEAVKAIVFGHTGGRPVTSGTRTIGSPVARSAVGEFTNTQNYVSRDASSLRTIGTWTALLTPTQPLVYDTLGLVSATNLLFAAQTFDPVNVLANETIAVQWTIYLRGA